MRHRICNEKIGLSHSRFPALRDAEILEAEAKWFPAGETFLAAANEVKGKPRVFLDAVKLFAKAAACFELAGQSRDAARSYQEAAGILYRQNTEFQMMGELYNRAAYNFKVAEEYFSAGSCYRNAADSFAKAPTPQINTEDNIPPVPWAAGKFTVAGIASTLHPMRSSKVMRLNGLLAQAGWQEQCTTNRAPAIMPIWHSGGRWFYAYGRTKHLSSTVF